jgi:hypothetical protein
MSLQEFPDENRRRFLANFGRFADLLNPPPVHYDDAIRDCQRFILIMGYEKSGYFEFALELFYPSAQLFPDHSIQSPERFIKQKNPRLNCKRPGKRHALALAPRQFGRKPVLEAPKLDQPKQFAHAPANLRRLWPEPPGEHFQAKSDILENIHVPEQSVMLKYETDSPFPDWKARSILVVVEKDPSGVRIIETRDHSQERGIPTSGRPQ